jgi:hypothetical protein
MKLLGTICTRKENAMRRLRLTAAVLLFFAIGSARAGGKPVTGTVYEHGDDYARLTSPDGKSSLYLAFFSDRKSLEGVHDGDKMTFVGKVAVGREESVLRYGIPVVVLKECRFESDPQEKKRQEQLNQSGKSTEKSSSGKDGKPTEKSTLEERKDEKREERERREEREHKERKELRREERKELERRERKEERREEREEKRDEREKKLENKKVDDKKQTTTNSNGKPGTYLPGTKPQSTRQTPSPQMQQYQHMLAQQHNAIQAHVYQQPRMQPGIQRPVQR